MNYTYQSYENLLKTIKEHEYTFCGYLNHEEIKGKKCILRHDIDLSIEKALEIAKIETKLGIFSTWFVMVSSDFYNPVSKDNLNYLREILQMDNHTIGLHFDPLCYENASYDELISFAEKEKIVLESFLDTKIQVVSLHRPTRDDIDKELIFDSMINAYSNDFFKEFEYMSDSRRVWRKPVLDIISNEEYQKLHILTHPIWYNQMGKDFTTTLKQYIDDETLNTRRWLHREISDLDEI